MAGSVDETAEAIERLVTTLKQREADCRASQKRFSASSEEMAQIVAALRAFPTSLRVVPPACDALHRCLDNRSRKACAAAAAAGALEALFKCRSHDPENRPWFLVAWIAAECTRKEAQQLWDSGWAGEALALLPTNLSTPLLPFLTKTLARCAVLCEECCAKISTASTVKVRRTQSELPSCLAHVCRSVTICS